MALELSRSLVAQNENLRNQFAPGYAFSDLMGQAKTRVRAEVLLVQVLVLSILVWPFVSPTFRDNDQASILDGAWQLARDRAPFLHAVFYNFDKQWGLFLALSWLYRLFPRADPVLGPNVLLTILASLAWISLGFRMGRTRNVPLPLVLPVLLSPVLILYIPYVGSGWFSLAFLLIAFFFLGRTGSKAMLAVGVISVAVAAACRGDVVLAIPALAVSQMSRTRFLMLVRRPLPWLLAVAGTLPVIAGKAMAGSSIPDSNPLSFDAKAYFGFLVFGLTPVLIALLVLTLVVFLRLAMQRRNFRVFYLCVAAAPLIPFGFYSLQLYTLRYLFLTIASLLFLISSRRCVWLYRSTSRRMRWTPGALITFAVMPWLVGFNVPALDHPRLTASDPTRFPTGDGQFPMGAYLGFEWQVLTKDHSHIDHNQRIWLASRSAAYQSCSDGAVPFLITPMSNFIEFAIRLQNKKPKPIDDMGESPCGIAYVDARSIIRGYRPTSRDGKFFEDQILFASKVNDGELIARIDSRGKQTDEGRILEKLAALFGPRETEIFTGTRSRITIKPGVRYAIFSTQSCRISIAGRELPATSNLIQATWVGSSRAIQSTAEAACSGALAGWARTSLPPYMGL